MNTMMRSRIYLPIVALTLTAGLVVVIHQNLPCTSKRLLRGSRAFEVSI